MGSHNDTPDTLTFTLKSIDLNRFYSLTGVDEPDNPVKVIYNPPATIIIWPMGDKTVVKCCEDDIYDPMTGFLLCCLKHYIGADNDPTKFHRFLKDFGPKPEQYDSEDIDLLQAYAKLNSAASKAAISIGDAAVRILDGITKAFGG